MSRCLSDCLMCLYFLLFLFLSSYFSPLLLSATRLGINCDKSQSLCFFPQNNKKKKRNCFLKKSGRAFCAKYFTPFSLWSLHGQQKRVEFVFVKSEYSVTFV
ncbi:hypothetical protein GE21DRAFT_1293095 [Neurospora crassa]|nr:hypothetical protein GE21DRAFT_1293095 [Neurospora crassa]